MNFQSKPVNIVAKLSESCVFNVFVITRTIHYAWLDIKLETFEPPNAMCIQLIDQNDKLYFSHSVNVSSVTVLNKSVCVLKQKLLKKNCGKLIA